MLAGQGKVTVFVKLSDLHALQTRKTVVVYSSIDAADGLVEVTLDLGCFTFTEKEGKTTLTIAN